MSSQIAIFEFIDVRIESAINKSYEDGGLATVGELLEELFSILHGSLNAKGMLGELKETFSHQAHEERLQRVLEQSRRYESVEEMKDACAEVRQDTMGLKKFITTTLKSQSKRVYETLGLLGFSTLFNVLDPRNQRHLVTTVNELIEVIKADLDEMMG